MLRALVRGVHAPAGRRTPAPARSAARRFLSADAAAAIKRTPAEAAARVACLHLVLSRWGLERTWDAWNGPEGGDPRQRELVRNRIAQGFDLLMSKVYSTGAHDRMTPREKQLMDLDLGTWCANKEREVEGRWESAGMICWALQLTGAAVPPYWEPFERKELFQATGIQPSVPDSVSRFLDGRVHAFRPAGDIADALRTAEVWYWRARAQSVWELKRDVLEPSAADSDPELEAKRKEARKRIPKALKDVANGIEGAIGQAAVRCAEDGLIPREVGGDYGVQVAGTGEAGTGGASAWARYSELDQASIDKLREIAEYRCSALGWLAGHEWDNDGNLAFVSPLSIWQPTENAT
ncbi:hypothetical protein DFJ74DRAFT_150236 [Hyaloraphidium curvatum]|nr:hypothetical protein DFJ74DRAFT_150236 [Hyaloraphidium curvatum]